MTFVRVLSIIALLAFSSSAMARAADGRDAIIQKAMNCVDGHLLQGQTITWNDVCDIPADYSQQRLQLINHQMDVVQGGNIPPQNTVQNPVQNFLQNPEPHHKESAWSYNVSTEGSSIKYVEHVSGSTFIKQIGSMWGINGHITYHPPDGSALNTKISDVYRLEGMFLYGKVTYYGGTENEDGSTNPITFHGISDYMVELRDLVGKDFYFNNRQTLFTPYVGIGYRSLFDTFSDLKPGGYNRRIQYIYGPVGFDITTDLNDEWAIGTNLEYDFFLRGMVTSYLGELGLGDVTNSQRGGYGLRGSIKLIRKLNCYNIFLEPYVRFWDIHASRVTSSKPFDGFIINGIYEPANTSLEIGSKLGVEF